MNEEEQQKQEFNRELEAWRSNPMTQEIRRQLEAQAEIAKNNVISAATVSTDPDVSRHAIEYRALRKLIDNMKEKP